MSLSLSLSFQDYIEHVSHTGYEQDACETYV